MTARIEQHDVTVHQGDAADVLRSLPSGSVQCVVTSPPYYALRDYGVDGQLGLESSPAEYVAAMVGVFREARRVLADDGVLFLVIADSYYSGRGNPGPNAADRKQRARRGFQRPLDKPGQPWARPKNLLGIPAKVAEALQGDGWLWRDDIAWFKPNAMHGPQVDRLGAAWEHILMFSKSRRYWFDRDPSVFWTGLNAWSIPTEPNASAHVAPYPYELARRCILMGTPREICTACGHARQRIIKREPDETRAQTKRALELVARHGLTDEHIAAIRSVGISDTGKAKLQQSGTGRNSSRVQELFDEAKAVLGSYTREFLIGKRVTAGWTECACAAPTRPGTVLDMFTGSGTTALVCRDLKIPFVGAELNGDYFPIIEQRIGQEPFQFEGTA